ncbi:hypothetical protein [Acutalibacter sp. 1XD8-36]|uniref:hypothetical protein n=1 Tax=Acutalibacter sp. 1XD8-36 TaxID=2320852 RepID=UPI001412F3D4|nr:hypothetical protein [Acutalibacter sp. 1XD8-36]NBJ89862.1 hypothetical protein [Acutalibacter sp. 1XD8-36]
MTKDLLEKYPCICGELKDLEQKNSFPKRREKLQQQKTQIEAFAESLPWVKRRLVLAVMKHGTRWDIIRREIESQKSADAVRKEYERIFKKF